MAQKMTISFKRNGKTVIESRKHSALSFIFGYIQIVEEMEKDFPEICAQSAEGTTIHLNTYDEKGNLIESKIIGTA